MTSVHAVTAPPDLPAEKGTAVLIGYGRISWDQLTALLADAEAAWADYTGFHTGPVPAEPPPYSHLWAWTSHWLARARIDHGDAITGVLALEGEPEPASPALSRETVTFQHAQAVTWPRTEKRVGQLPGHIADQPMDVYLIPGDTPITFTAARLATNIGQGTGR